MIYMVDGNVLISEAVGKMDKRGKVNAVIEADSLETAMDKFKRLVASGYATYTDVVVYVETVRELSEIPERGFLFDANLFVVPITETGADKYSTDILGVTPVGVGYTPDTYEDGYMTSKPFWAQKPLEEGDECPECGGELYYPEVENCSCHISPPCSACTSILLTCEECGWEYD